MKFRDCRDNDFHALVRARAGAYFESRGISRYANGELWTKAAVLVGTTLALYALILSNRLSGFPLLLAAIAFGVSSILAAFNVAHDAAHNALVPSRRVNALIYFLVFNVQGANAYLWKLRHIGSHHVFPNVEGGDADMDDNGLLRVSPHAPGGGTTVINTCTPPCSTRSSRCTGSSSTTRSSCSRKAWPTCGRSATRGPRWGRSSWPRRRT